MPDVFWAAFGGAAAAGLATLIALLAAEWFKWFLDRPLLKVEISLGHLIAYGDTDPKVRQVFLEASNPHSKPVTISTFGLFYKRYKWGTLYVTPQIGYQFPYQLDGGKLLGQWTSLEELLKAIKKAGRTPRDLKWVWFKASSGKTYRGKIKKWIIKELEEEFQKMNGDPTPSAPSQSPS